MKSRLFVCAGVVVVAVTGAACSSSSPKASDRMRRGDTKSKTETTKKITTLPPLTSSTVAPVTPTNVPAIDAKGIKTTWTQEKMCDLITPGQVKEILKMSTSPTGKYSYVAQEGARCTFASSLGDELFYGISTSTYNQARAVDTALAKKGVEVTVEGFQGVVTTDDTGSILELNLYGETSNEWIIGTPKESQAKALAKELIRSLALK